MSQWNIGLIKKKMGGSKSPWFFLLVILTSALGELSQHQGRERLMQNRQTGQAQLQSMLQEIQEIKAKFDQQDAIISQQANEIQDQETELQNQEVLINHLLDQVPKSNRGTDRGTVYTRWGKNSCSRNSTLVYSGFTAGSPHTNKGSSSKNLCMPKDPIWSSPEPPVASDEVSELQGSEIEFAMVDQHTLPCAVCMSPLGSEVVMIPGRNRCYGGWNEEYRGYLVGPRYDYQSDDYLCLDDHPDTVSGGHADQNGHLFYFVVGQCGSLKCPPYTHGKVITCVVCSK